MRKLIIGEPRMTWSFRNDPHYDKVVFLFCDLSDLDIWGLRADEVDIIGSYIGEGILEECKIKKLSFLHCFQSISKEINISLSTVKNLSIYDSVIHIHGETSNSTINSKSLEMGNRLDELSRWFSEEMKELQEDDFNRIYNLLNRYPEDTMLTFIISSWVLREEERTGAHFLPEILRRISSLGGEDQGYFKQYFKYLLADEYQYLQENEKAMAFINARSQTT